MSSNVSAGSAGAVGGTSSTRLSGTAQLGTDEFSRDMTSPTSVQDASGNLKDISSLAVYTLVGCPPWQQGQECVFTGTS
jgi:hypothetical protein